MKIMLIQSFIMKYRKKHANKLFAPMMINGFVSIVLLTMIMVYLNVIY